MRAAQKFVAGCSLPTPALKHKVVYLTEFLVLKYGLAVEPKEDINHVGLRVPTCEIKFFVLSICVVNFKNEEKTVEIM